MNWRLIHHFSEAEFCPPGHVGPVGMEPAFVLELDRLRQDVGSAFVIHANGGFAHSGHEENSLHYRGLAVDLHIRQAGSERPRDIVEQAVLAYKWSSFSIGIYPWWNCPGLHLDGRTAIGRENIVWFKDQDGRYRYYPYARFDRCLRDLIPLLDAPLLA
jgi:hypothetical protein